jgi:hypothetical protein
MAAQVNSHLELYLTVVLESSKTAKNEEFFVETGLCETRDSGLTTFELTIIALQAA